MRVPELPHMRELSAGLRDLTLQLPHLGSCQTRINTGFSANFLISISQAAQCLGTQVAHAALGRRGFLRDAGFCLACRLGRPLGNVPPGRSGPALGVRDRTGQAAFLRSARAGPSTQVGRRQVKVSSTFSKVVGFGVKPQDLTGVRGVLVPGGHRSGPVYVATSVGAGHLPLADSTRGGSRDPKPPPSHTSKKEGTDVPLLGCHRARGFCLWKGQAQCLRARSRGYLLRSVRPVRCTSSTGCAG